MKNVSDLVTGQFWSKSTKIKNFFCWIEHKKYTSQSFFISKQFFILELSRKFYFMNIFFYFTSSLFYFFIRSLKIFEIRSRKFLFTQISRKCEGGLKIRAQRKISRRMRYNDMGSIFDFIVDFERKKFWNLRDFDRKSPTVRFKTLFHQ